FFPAERDGTRKTQPLQNANHASSSHPRQAWKSNENEKENVFASPGGSVIPGTLWVKPCASTEGFSREAKIRLITIGLLRDLSEIKLKRTDTTLDLSQT